MSFLSKLLFPSIFILLALLQGTTAFSRVAPATTIMQATQHIGVPTTTMPPPLARLRGGGPSSTRLANVASGGSVDPSGKAKKMRIAAFDSMRFFLIAQIVLGHFVRFAQPNSKVLNFCSHHNVIVGFFFILSGYVTAYTTTENGQLKASARLTDTPSQQWILGKIFGYLPLHLFVLALFSPVFLYADVHYSGWLMASWHGLMSATMTQAWFPMHAEVWNAPTWFLSALTFATALFPFALPKIAEMDKKKLKKLATWLFLVTVIPKIGYCYDLNAWKIAEGVTSPKHHPNLALFNNLRFSPLSNAAEVFLGAVVCRLAMLDSLEGHVSTNALSTLVPLLGIVGVMVARAANIFPISDMLARSLIFIPLFLRFMIATHRNTVNGVKDPIVRFLSSKPLGQLGALAFPIFILHGPIGQVFFKKLIATKLFGKVLMGPKYFSLYCLTTLVSAWVVQKVFVSNKAVANWSKKTVESLSSWM